MEILLQTDTAQVIRGDALDFYRQAPDDYVDAIVTDPPYSPHVHANIRSITGGEVTHWTPGFEPRSDEMLATIAEHACRIAKRWTLHFCELDALGDFARAFGPDRYVRSFVWRKMQAAPSLHGRWAANSCEGIAIAHRATARHWNGGGRHAWHNAGEPCRIAEDNCIVAGRNRAKKAHPAQKPIALADQLILDWTDPGEIVADTFGGSGALGLAALRNGRRAIIVERDPLWALVCALSVKTPEQALHYAQQARAAVDGGTVGATIERLGAEL